MYKKNIFIMVLVILVLFLPIYSANAESEDQANICVIPVSGEINPAQAGFVKSAIEKAEAEKFDLIILDINTPGGLIDSAFEIKDAIFDCNIRTISFVNKRALSAGVLLAVSCDKMYMAPGSTIGAAETIPNDEKILSAWKEDVISAAEVNGKDADIVSAMIDRDVEIEGLIDKGKLLTLSSTKAQQIGFSDGTFQNISKIAEVQGFDSYKAQRVDSDFKVNLAKMVSSAYVAPFLLSIGIISLIIEIFAAGFGLAGTISIVSFSLYFWGNILAGNADWGAVILFLAGLMLLLIELGIPGFGVVGAGGIICVILSIFLASSSPQSALISLVTAIILSIIILPITFKYVSKSKIFDKIILRYSQKDDSGNIGWSKYQDYLDKSGYALTDLRPSGAVDVNGEKIDVVSEGEFIDRGSEVKVVRVEGRKIVVKKI
ncbi:MAG: NfeD family protein [Clostridia bacterium]|nr:NfeD family protein [Clostridia bacterium]